MAFMAGAQPLSGTLMAMPTACAHRIVVEDSLYENTPIDLPAEVLFGKPPKMLRNVQSAYARSPRLVRMITSIDVLYNSHGR